MLKAALIFLFFIAASHVIAQPISVEDSLRNVIQLHKGDTAEVSALALLGSNQTQLDSGVKFLQHGLLLAEKLGYKKGEADCLLRLAQKISDRGQTIQYCLDALRIFEELKDAEGVAASHLVLQWNYRESGDYKNSLIHAFKGEQKAEADNVIGQRNFPGSRLAPLFLAEIGGTYLLKNQLDSASFFTQQSIEQNELFNGAAWNFPVYLLATIQSMQGNYEVALKNYRKANSLAIQNGFEMDTLQIQSGMSTLFLRTGQLDSAIYYRPCSCTFLAKGIGDQKPDGGRYQSSQSIPIKG